MAYCEGDNIILSYNSQHVKETSFKARLLSVHVTDAETCI